MLVLRFCCLLGLLFGLIVFSLEVKAREPFSYDITWTPPNGEGVRLRGSNKSLKDAIENLDIDTLERLVQAQRPGTTARDIEETGSITGTIDLRGIPVELSYTAPSDPSAQRDVKVTIKDANYSEVFSAQEFSQIGRDLQDAFIKNEGGVLTRVLQAGVSKSPLDLIAGNPDSMMSRLTQVAFLSGTSVFSSAPSAPLGFNWGARYARSSSSGYDTQVASLLIQGAYRFSGSGIKLIFDFPFYYSRTGSANSFGLISNFSVRVPLLKFTGYGVSGDWSLTPSGGLGVGGSLDLASGGLLYSVAVNSNLDLSLQTLSRLKLSVGNMVGYYQSIPIEVAGFNLKYDLNNLVMRHGAGLRWSFNQNLATHVFYAFTNFFRERLYIDRYHDIGLNLEWKVIADSDQRIYARFIYSRGHDVDYDRFRVELAHQF